MPASERLIVSCRPTGCAVLFVKSYADLLNTRQRECTHMLVPLDALAPVLQTESQVVFVVCVIRQTRIVPEAELSCYEKKNKS